MWLMTVLGISMNSIQPKESVTRQCLWMLLQQRCGRGSPSSGRRGWLTPIRSAGNSAKTVAT